MMPVTCFPPERIICDLTIQTAQDSQPLRPMFPIEYIRVYASLSASLDPLFMESGSSGVCGCFIINLSRRTKEWLKKQAWYWMMNVALGCGG